MELVNSLISSIHVVSASLSILFGGWVLIKGKGTLRHKKIGLYYFVAMLVNNSTALTIYNAFGEWFFPHWLALAALAIIIPGYYISRLKNKSYALKVHIIAMVLSYYLLIGGAINETFLHIPYLSQFFLAENLSPLDVSHLIALVFFVLLILKYLMKYWSNIFPNK